MNFLDFNTCTENQQKETDPEPNSALKEPENTIVPELFVMDENGQYHFKSDFLDSNTCSENQQNMRDSSRETPEETLFQNKTEKKFKLNSKLDIQKEDAVSANPSVDAFSDVSYKASRYAQDATGNATEDALTETLDAPMQGNLLRGIDKKTV